MVQYRSLVVTGTKLHLGLGLNCIRVLGHLGTWVCNQIALWISTKSYLGPLPNQIWVRDDPSHMLRGIFVTAVPRATIRYKAVLDLLFSPGYLNDRNFGFIEKQVLLCGPPILILRATSGPDHPLPGSHHFVL